jgi:hypothetical protein
LAKDLATANKPAKRTPKKIVFTKIKGKKTASIVSNRQKVSTQPRARAKSPVKRIVVVPSEEVVVLGVTGVKTTSRIISLP